MKFLLDLIFVVIVAICVFVSWKKGFIEAMFDALTTVASLILAFLFGPGVGEWICSKGLGEKLSQTVYDVIHPLIARADAGMNISGFLQGAGEELGKFNELAEKYGVSLSSLTEKFGSITEGTEADVRSIAEAIAGPASVTISRVLGCVIVFVAALIVLAILKFLLNALFELPLLKEINETAGALLGVVTGIAVVWGICLVLSLLTEFSILGESGGTFLQSLTSSSYIFRFLCSLSPLEFLNLLK